MPASLHIVTGSSRGLGAAIAEQLLAPGATLLCIARHLHPTLDAQARAAGATLLQWQRDLSDPLPVARELGQWLAAFDAGAHRHADLINNAAIIGRVGPVDRDDDEQLSRVVRVGLEAPLLLGAAFLRATAGWSARRRILNISSGLGRRAMAGSASYCAVKAGLDNLSRAMALDEAARPGGARIVSLAPGVIDTDMQRQLRAADGAGFPDLPSFVALQQQGRLDSPQQCARKLVEFLRRADFGSDAVADLRSA